jgi:hypothetical protein
VVDEQSKQTDKDGPALVNVLRRALELDGREERSVCEYRQTGHLVAYTRRHHESQALSLNAPAVAPFA